MCYVSVFLHFLRMAWTSQRGRRRESSPLSGHRKPKVQRNLSLSVSEENVDDLLEPLSMLSNDKNTLPGALDDVVLGSTSAYSQPETVLNLNTYLTATKSSWCGDHGISSYSANHETSQCFTDEDTCGHRNRRTWPDSGRHYGSALGGCVGAYQYKHRKCRDKHQEKAVKDHVYKVPLQFFPASLTSTYPGSASYYPDFHSTLDRHQRELTNEAHCVNDACLKQSEHVSTFQDIVESSWISASLHRSMLDIEIGLSFGDLQPQGQTTSRNIALSATITPLDVETHDSAVSCSAKISSSVLHCHPGDTKTNYTCKHGFSTECPYIYNVDQLTNRHFQRDSVMNATAAFTKCGMPGEPFSTKHCESTWKTPLEVYGANLYSCKEWPLPESLSCQQKEVAFPDNVTKWPKELASPSDSGHSLYAHPYHTRGMETSFEVPDVRRNFETDRKSTRLNSSHL